MRALKIDESAKHAILTLADVKDAVAAFDHGEVNVLAALEAVRAAVARRAPVARAARRAARHRRRAA